jgi:hypothetical protein
MSALTRAHEGQKRLDFKPAFFLVAGLLLSSSSAVAQVYDHTPDCDRACLTGFMDQYLTAQAANDTKGLPLAKTVKVTENGETIKPGSGLFKTADEPTFRMDIADPEMGGIASELVVKEGDGFVFELVRLKVEDGKITEVETMVGRKGESGPMFVPDFATEPRREFTQSIRPAERMSRLELMATADAYWRALETNGRPDYHRAPLLPGTIRIENGLPTTNGSGQGGGTTGGPEGVLASSALQQFDTGMFSNRTIYNRRFPVVDVERGVVLSIARMGIDEGAEEPPHWKGGRPLLCEFFAIQGGVITAVDVVMKSTVAKDGTNPWPREPLTQSKSDPD